MINFAVNLAHYLTGWVILTIALSWFCALIYPYASRGFTTISSVPAATCTLACALLAPVTALITTAVLSSPTWADYIVKPHCHGNLCEPHSLEFVAGTLPSSMLLATAIAGVVVVGILMSSQLIKGRYRSRTLEALSRLDETGYLQFEHPNRVAWCFGMLKPKVFISSGLVHSLSDKQRQIVLAHGTAHASRYDNLRRWLLHWSTFLWPNKSKRKIRGDFAHYSECVCDLVAFNALDRAIDDVTFVTTLQSVYDKSAPNTKLGTQANWQHRLAYLRREIGYLDRGNPSLRIQGIVVGMLITLLWFLITAGTVYLGHPLLENLPF